MSGTPVEPAVTPVPDVAVAPGATAEPRSRGIDTLLTAVAQVTVLLGAALLGVLIARRFGSTAATDGFFAANAVYGLTLFVAQSLRTTTAAALVGDDGFGRLRAHLGGVVWLFGASVVLAVGAAALAEPLGLAPDARSSFQRSILILCPAAGLQLVAGQCAAMLAALDDYVSPAVAYACGSVAAIVGFVALAGPLEVTGVPTALAAGSVASAAIAAGALARRGWHPRPPILDRSSVAVARQMALGAISLVAAQLVLALSVAFAGATGVGNASLYSYAMMVVMLLTAALASPISIVFAPVVARTWDGRPASLVPTTMTGYRAGALLLGPAVAAVVLLGPQTAAVVLSSLPDRSIDRIFDLTLVLAPSLLGTMLAMIPLVALFAQRRFRTLAAWSGAVVALHLVLCAAAVALGGVILVAAAGTISSVALAAVPVVLVFGREADTVLRPALRAIADFVVPAALAFGAAAALVAFDRSLGRGAPAFVLGAIAYGAWICLRHRTEAAALLGALRPRRL
jgi:peptidoglycan biosynthesis protein MviN/MurJ (putative lipid II flippase)